MIPIFVQYNGRWNESMEYVDFQVKGILLATNSSYDVFIQQVQEELKFEKYMKSISISYNVKVGYPPILIENDANLIFYIEMKKKELDYTMYPICVTIEDTNQDYTITDSSSRGKELQIAMIDAEAEEVENMHFINYASTVTDAIVEASTENQEEEADQSNIIQANVIASATHAKIEVGQLYKNKQILKTVMTFYAIQNNFQFKVKRSCSKEYSLKCLDSSCNWFVRTSKYRCTKMFKVRKLNNNHSCPLETRMKDHRQPTSSMIGEFIKSKYLNIKTSYTPADIVRDMKNDYGINLNYIKAWRSKETALAKVRGTPDSSYQLLPSYLCMIQATNPGSMIELELDQNRRFMYVFMALEASIEGWKHCRPVFVVDGTFLKSSYGGTMLTASTQDADGRIFPLAFAIVDSENDESWLWFFTYIKKTYGVRENMCIISDRHESIQNAIRNVYPDCIHGLCIYHLLNNLKTRFKKHSKQIKDSFFGAAKAYTKDEFDTYMAELDVIDNRIRPYLQAIGYEKWSRAHCNNNRYNTMTSNIAESLNAASKSARELPITTLLESLRGLVQKWSWQNRNAARCTFTRLTKYAEDILKQNFIQSSRLKVEPANDYLYKVIDIEKPYIVHLQDKTCTCNKFQMDEIPCPHAIAALKELNKDPYELCTDFYCKEKWIATYDITVQPIAHKDSWDIPENIKTMQVWPPQGRLKAGRPKNRRLKPSWEYKNTKEMWEMWTARTQQKNL